MKQVHEQCNQEFKQQHPNSDIEPQICPANQTSIHKSGKCRTTSTMASDELQVGNSISADMAHAEMPYIERTNQILKEIYENWDDVSYAYQWPASRLSRHEMARLTIVSNAVKRPLNQLIKEAVDVYATDQLRKLGYLIPDNA